jgi:hypothetical protein
MTTIVFGVLIAATAFLVIKRFRAAMDDRRKLREAKERLKYFEETGKLPEEEEDAQLFENTKRITFRR